MSWFERLLILVFVNQYFLGVFLKYEASFGNISEDAERVAYRKTMPEISFGECKNTCSLRSECWFINYHVTAHICYVVEFPVRGRGYLRSIKRTPNYATSVKIEFNEDKSMITYEKGCDPPPSITGARILGNMQNVGSRVHYLCDDRAGAHDIIKCLPNNTWSSTNLTCNKDLWLTFAGSDLFLKCCFTEVPESLLSQHGPHIFKESCEEMGGYLADITDEAEMKHVIKYLESLPDIEAFHWRTIFIGLNNIVDSSVFERMNGHVATFFYWQPSTQMNDEHSGTTPEYTTNDFSNNTTLADDNIDSKNESGYERDKSDRTRERCVSMVVRSGLKWAKTNCEEHHPSLCEFENDGSREHYWFYSNATTWAKAKEKCKSYGGYLADINNNLEVEDVYEYIHELLGNEIESVSYIFIGLNNHHKISEFRWMNGEIATYFNWEIPLTSSYLTDDHALTSYWSNSSFADGITDTQSTLYTTSTTVSHGYDWSDWSRNLIEQCVVIMVEKEYKWTTVNCFVVEIGLCEFDAPFDDTEYGFIP